MINLVKNNLIKILKIKHLIFLIVINISYIITKIELNIISSNNKISVFEGAIYPNTILILAYLLYKTSVIYSITSFFYTQINTYIQNIIIRIGSLKSWILSVIITSFMYVLIYHGITIIVSVLLNVNKDILYIDINLFFLNILSSFLSVLISLIMILLFYDNPYITPIFIIFFHIFSISIFLIDNDIGKIIPINHSLRFYKDTISLSYLYLFISIIIILFLMKLIIYKIYEKFIVNKGDL